MHSDHPLADNLFGRLQTYSPREGREPLEDFCTEALSYCLRAQPDLLAQFLKWTSPSVGRDGAGQPEIHTQLSYRHDEDAGADGPPQKGGRFDLVLESEDFVIVVEVKVWSDFRENQLAEYRRQLDRGTRFADRKCRKFLVTLTPRSAPSIAPYVTIDAHVKWSIVQESLERLGKAGSDSTSLVCREFAEFLKEKGLAPMHLSKINAPGPMNLLDVLRLREDLEEILNAYRSDKRISALVKNKIVTQKAPEEYYIFLWGRQAFPHSVGFELAEKAGGKTLGLYLEGKAQGHVTDAQVKDVLQKRFKDRLATCYRSDGYVVKDGATWIPFCQTVEGSLDGDAEAIRDWLVLATLDLVELGELLTQAIVPDLRA